MGDQDEAAKQIELDSVRNRLMKRKDELQKELKQLSKELRPKKSKPKVMEEVQEEKITEEEKNNDMLLEYHKEQKSFKAKSKKNPIPTEKDKREAATLAILAKFKQKLSGIEVENEEENEVKKKDEKEIDEEDEDDDDLTGDNWLKNKLVFERNDPVVAKDASTKDDEWFDIYDPRNALNKRRRENDAGNRKEQDRKKMGL